jgi:hypothetical protein
VIEALSVVKWTLRTRYKNLKNDVAVVQLQSFGKPVKRKTKRTRKYSFLHQPMLFFGHRKS